MISSIGSASRSQTLASRHPCGMVRARSVQIVRAGKKWDDVASDMIDKYMNTGALPSGSRALDPDVSLDVSMATSGSAKTAKQNTTVRAKSSPGVGVGNGVIFLLVANYIVFALSQLTNLPLISSLPLYSSHTNWWSFITYAFCHADLNHLANNMFMLLVFGRSVEEEEGAFGVLVTYLLCGIGSAAAFLLTSSPRAALVGASGSVFGLFVVSVLSKLSQFNLRRLVEVLAMAPFVYGQITSNAAMQLSGAASSVSYIAHLGGAATGFLLVALLALLPGDT